MLIHWCQQRVEIHQRDPLHLGDRKSGEKKQSRLHKHTGMDGWDEPAA